MKRRQQDNNEEEEEDLTLRIPNEIMWLIFQYMGVMWRIEYPPAVCKAWTLVLRNECLHIDEPSINLMDKYLRRVPNLHTLKKWCPMGTGSGSLANLTALTTLEIEHTLRNSSRYVFTGLANLINLTAVGMESMLFGNMTKLRMLDLSYNREVTNEIIAGLTCLRELRLLACSRLTADCLSTLRALHTLALSVSGVTDETLWHLTNLTSLKVGWAKISDRLLTQRLTQLSSLSLIVAGKYITTDGLLGLHLLTRLIVDGPGANRDYSPFTNLRHLESYSQSPLVVPQVERNYHLLTNLVTLKCDDELHLTPEWIKRMPHLRELSVSPVTLAPHGIRENLAQFILLEGRLTNCGKISLLK